MTTRHTSDRLDSVTMTPSHGKNATPRAKRGGVAFPLTWLIETIIPKVALLGILIFLTSHGALASWYVSGGMGTAWSMQSDQGVGTLVHNPSMAWWSWHPHNGPEIFGQDAIDFAYNLDSSPLASVGHQESATAGYSFPAEWASALGPQFPQGGGGDGWDNLSGTIGEFVEGALLAVGGVLLTALAVGGAIFGTKLVGRVFFGFKE